MHLYLSKHDPQHKWKYIVICVLAASRSSVNFLKPIEVYYELFKHHGQHALPLYCVDSQ